VRERVGDMVIDSGRDHALKGFDDPVRLYAA
jgi:hypothetical protein